MLRIAEFIGRACGSVRSAGGKYISPKRNHMPPVGNTQGVKMIWLVQLVTPERRMHECAQVLTRGVVRFAKLNSFCWRRKE